MEPVIGFFVLFALAVLIVPLVLSVTHASRLRAVESALKKFSERLTVLEAGTRKDGLPSPKRTSSSTGSGGGRRSGILAASETATGARQPAASAPHSDAAPNEYAFAGAGTRSPRH